MIMNLATVSRMSRAAGQYVWVDSADLEAKLPCNVRALGDCQQCCQAGGQLL